MLWLINSGNVVCLTPETYYLQLVLQSRSFGVFYADGLFINELGTIKKHRQFPFHPTLSPKQPTTKGILDIKLSAS